MSYILKLNEFPDYIDKNITEISNEKLFKNIIKIEEYMNENLKNEEFKNIIEKIEIILKDIDLNFK